MRGCAWNEGLRGDTPGLMIPEQCYRGDALGVMLPWRYSGVMLRSNTSGDRCFRDDAHYICVGYAFSVPAGSLG